MKLTKREFLAEVKRELKHLRKNVTIEEVNKLDIATLDPNSSSDCIYGQMFGGCSNDRAKSMWPKTFRMSGHYEGDERNWKTIDKERGSNRTPLEKFLFLSTREMNIQIIQYLKGEVKNITLSCI